MIATRSREARWTLLSAVVLSFGLLGARCGGGGFQVTVNTPSFGAFLTTPNAFVSGVVNASNPQIASLTVNGVSVLPVGPGGTWSVSLPLDQAGVFNTFLVEGIRTNGTVSRKVITVHYGDHVDDGDFSPMGVALRLNDTGLDDVEPLVQSLVGAGFDLGTLLPVGTVLISNECFVDGGFLGCLGRATVSIKTPAPNFDNFAFAMDSMTNFVAGDIDINGVETNIHIAGTGLVPNCDLRIEADQVQIDGDYGLQADAVDPSNIDVNQVGAQSVSFTNFTQTYTGGTCDIPVIGDIIQLFIGDLEGDVVAALANFLNDPDGSGPLDGPIADGVETALADIEISGPIGQSLGVNLETPLFDVYEDTAGITLDSDARITALMPDPNAVDITATYHVQEVFPSYGATSPVLGLPYDLAIGISTSAFNQLLKAEVESGLLITTISEFPNPFPPHIPPTIPITAQILKLLGIPAFGSLPNDLLMSIDIKPLLSPIVTGEAGPGGELADMRLGGLLATVRGENSVIYLQVFIDAEVGLDMNFANGELSFALGTPTPDGVKAYVQVNPLGADPANLEQQLLPDLVASTLPTLASSLGTFPLPDFLGFQLDLVEIAKNGEYMSLFVNLTPAP